MVLTRQGQSPNFTLVLSPAEIDLIDRIGASELTRLIQSYFNGKLTQSIEIDKRELEKRYFKLSQPERQQVLDLIQSLSS